MWAAYWISYLCFVISSTLVTGWVPTLVRAGRGMMLFPRATTQPPDTLLVLYSYENNQVENNHPFVSWVHEKQYLLSAVEYDNYCKNKSEPEKSTQFKCSFFLVAYFCGDPVKQCATIGFCHICDFVFYFFLLSLSNCFDLITVNCACNSERFESPLILSSWFTGFLYL